MSRKCSVCPSLIYASDFFGLYGVKFLKGESALAFADFFLAVDAISLKFLLQVNKTGGMWPEIEGRVRYQNITTFAI
jgi:hypothetical protein